MASITHEGKKLVYHRSARPRLWGWYLRADEDLAKADRLPRKLKKKCKAMGLVFQSVCRCAGCREATNRVLRASGLNHLVDNYWQEPIHA